MDARPDVLRALALGLAAAVPVALVYGLLADPFGLTWGLLVIGIFGGMIVGGSVAYGGWLGAPHVTVRNLRMLAVALAVFAWLLGSVASFVFSQVFYQAASTPLGERLTLASLAEYVPTATDLPKLVTLLAMAVMAWRGAR